MHGGGDELLADPCLAFDENGDAGVDDLLELPEEISHRRRRSDDLLRPTSARAALLLAALEVRVLFFQALFCGAEALDQAGHGDGQRYVVREHGDELEIAGNE